MAKKMSTKSTPILISPEYYFLAFWHFFSFVICVSFADFFHGFSFPSNLQRKKGPTDEIGVF